MIDFHGWTMPVQFSGIAAEHLAVRTGTGIFDLGHMGRLRIFGTGSLAFLARRVCRKLDDLRDGQIRYGLVLAADGTVEDDVLVGRESADSYHVVVNASNVAKIVALWRPELAGDVRLDDLTATQAMVAVQGPQAVALLKRLGLDLGATRYYHFTDVAWRGTTVRLSRTGYTGEDGAECFLPVERVCELWTALVEAGATPCGLGSRDILRLEAAMPLYGNELDRSVTPVEAGLDFAVNRNGGFIGAETVLAQLANGPAKKLVGLRMRDRRVPRTHYPILKDGAVIGQVTSGTLSPSVGAAIGLGYVASRFAAVGTSLDIDIRGAICAAEVVALPFYRRAKPA